MEKTEQKENKKKTMLIIGGTSNLGRYLTLYFAERNYNVIITYNKNHKEARNIKKLVKIINRNINIYKCDINRISSIKRFTEIIKRRYKKIDYLINVVGRINKKSPMKMSYKEWTHTINNNLTGNFFLTKMLLPMIKKSKQGRIINFGFHNINKDIGFEGILPYAIAKQGLLLTTKTLALNLKRNNITANMISPGILVGSEKGKELIGSKKDIIEYRNIVDLIEYLISKKGERITGENITIDNGLALLNKKRINN